MFSCCPSICACVVACARAAPAGLPSNSSLSHFVSPLCYVYARVIIFVN